MSDTSSKETARAPSPAVLGVADVAERWDVDRKAIYGMIERGELPALRIGRLIRISRYVVERLEQAGAVQGG